MSTTADLLNKLVSQKNTLADNLVTKGVPASHEETLKTLVPKVLDITEGSGYIEKHYIYDNGKEMNNHVMTIYHKSSSSKKSANWIYLYGYYTSDLSSDKIICTGYSKLCITLMSDSTKFPYTPKFLKLLCTDEAGATLTENDYTPNGNVLKSVDAISYPDAPTAGVTYEIDISDLSEFYLHFQNVNTDTYVLGIWLERAGSGSVVKNMSFDKWEHRSGTMPTFGYEFDKDGWAGPFSMYSYIAIDKLFIYEKSFEIMFNFKLDSVPNRANVMIGSSIYNSFYRCPSMELQASKIWCGLSYDGNSWNKNVSASITWEVNREYYVKYSYNNDSKILKLELSYDGKNWETLSTTEDVEMGYQCVSTEYLELGGIAQSSNHNFGCGKINLFKSYIKLDDELFWGIEYN